MDVPCPPALGELLAGGEGPSERPGEKLEEGCWTELQDMGCGSLGVVFGASPGPGAVPWGLAA